MDPVKNLTNSARNSVSSTSANSISEFHAAVEREDVTTIEALLKMGIDIESRNESGLTALMTAVKRKNKPIIELLLNYGADIGANSASMYCGMPEEENRTILHYAVEHVFDDSIVNMLIKMKKNVKPSSREVFSDSIITEKLILPKIIPVIDMQTRDNFSALFLAIQQKRIPIVKSLLENGASLHRFPAYRDYYGNLYESCTLIHMIALWYDECEDEKEEEMMRLLIEHGLDIDATTKCSLTALLIAIQYNEFTLVEILIRLGADVNKKASNRDKSKTLIPLHQALRHPGGKVFEYLLDTKKVNKQDLLSASEHVIYCSNSEEMAEILLQSFLSDDYRYPKSDAMVLNLAIIAKNDRVIQSFIIHNNSNVPLMKWRGQYPIHRAVKSNNVQCIVRLLRIGANIDATDNFGRTALYYTAKKQHSPLTFFLLRLGANISGLDNTKGHRWLESMITLENTEFIEDYLDKSPNIFHFYTPRPDEYFAGLVTKYIIKSIIANIPFDQYYLGWQEFRSRDTIEEISRDCKTEISLLKQEKISRSSFLTYHHFLTNNVHRLANYVRNINVTSSFNQNQVSNKFPIYGKIIINSYYRAMQHLTLILQFETELRDILCYFPANFVRRIPHYLSDRDLRMLPLPARNIAEIR